MALPHGGKGVDNPGAGRGADRKDSNVREGHLLLLRCAKLAQGGERVPAGIQ